MCLFDIERRERETSKQSKASQGTGKARLAVSRLALPGANQGNGKASLAMSCLALPGESPLYRKNKETHLIFREKERGHGMGRGKARQGQGHGNPRQSKATPPLYKEDRDSFSTQGGECLSSQ